MRYAHGRQLDPSFRTHTSGSRHERFVPITAMREQDGSEVRSVELEVRDG